MARPRTPRPSPVATVNGLTLTLSPEHGNLISLEAGGRAWVNNGPAGLPLWQIRVADADGRRAVLTAADARVAKSATRGDTLRLVWQGVRDVATGAGPFAVTVTLTPYGDQPGAAAWRIQVANPTRDWTLWEVTFPILQQVTAGADGAADRFFHPHGWGVQLSGWQELAEVRRRYPRGWDCGMQVVGWSSGAETLYLAAHDPRLCPKEFHFRPDPSASPRHCRLAVTLYPDGMTLAGNSYTQDFDIVTAVLRGDWYDAARLYGGWARRQPWAAAPPPRASTEPRADREIHAWQVIQFPAKSADQWADETERLAARLDVRLGAHLYNWHQIPFDTSYPDYFPARPEFADFARRLRAAGIVVMPYINGRLWDINAKSWRARRAERFAVKHSAERLDPRTLVPYLEEYGSGQKLAPMCVATAFWRDTVRALCRRIVRELGCDGVYIDQIAAEKAELCFNRQHPHAPGGGGFWLDGYRRLAADIRADIGPNPTLTTECNWEGCIADYDALLSWAWFAPNEIPLFPAAYAGLARSFGCSFSDNDIRRDGGDVFARKMARLLVWGAQLGWGDLTPLLDAAQAPLLEFFASLCRLRAGHLALFARGRMLRPPTLDARAAAAVYTAVWADDDARPTLFAVNPAREAVTAAFTFTDLPGRRLTLRLPARTARAVALA